jgi:hypothetical protein
MNRALLLTALLALTACPGPMPAPVTPPGPVPVDPTPPWDPPDPAPAATPCGRAEQHGRSVLGCSLPANFVQTCESYGQLAGSSGYDPECMQHAPDCDAFSDCRGGT